MVFTLMCNHVVFLPEHYPTLQDQPRAQVFHQEDTHYMDDMVQTFQQPMKLTMNTLHIFGVENKYLINKNKNISLVSIFKNLFDRPPVIVRRYIVEQKKIRYRTSNYDTIFERYLILTLNRVY